MNKFRVWLDDGEYEDDGKEYEGCVDADDAAQEHAQYMSDSGAFPDHVGDRFELMVRDLSTGEKSKVEIAWEYDPCPYVAKSEKLESADV